VAVALLATHTRDAFGVMTHNIAWMRTEILAVWLPTLVLTLKRNVDLMAVPLLVACSWSLVSWFWEVVAMLSTDTEVDRRQPTVHYIKFNDNYSNNLVFDILF